jgi:hypothetical protein
MTTYHVEPHNTNKIFSKYKPLGTCGQRFKHAMQMVNFNYQIFTILLLGNFCSVKMLL